MQFALDPWGKKIGPREGPWGYCLKCGEHVKAKCGEIITPHFEYEGGTAWLINRKRVMLSPRITIHTLLHSSMADA